MRAYHRIDPLMDEKKGHYTPAQFGAFVKVQLLAGRQTDRGYFRSTAAIKGLLPAAYARHVDFLVGEGDIVDRGARVYVDGWDEWQEGDLTVRDRMARLRNRRRNEGVTGDAEEPSQRTDPPLSPHTPQSPPRVSVGVGAGRASPPAHEGGNDPYDAPELPALSWLTEHGCYIAPVSGYYRQLVLVVENYGVDAVIAKFDTLKKAGVKRGDVRNFLFGAIDALNGKVDIKGLETEERAEADRDRRTRAADAARKAAEDEDARRARLLAEKPRPLRELMPDVKIGRASS